jgi:HK97 family phage portal protein
LEQQPLEGKASFTTTSYTNELAPYQFMFYGNQLVYSAQGGGTEQARNLAENSAAFACLHTLCTDYAEAPPRMYKEDPDGGDPEVMPDHALELLLRNPNPHITYPSLAYHTQWAKQVDGNAYWLKIRSAAGTVVELWPVSPLDMKPVTFEEDRQNGVFISAYRWDRGAGDIVLVDPNDVVHFRIGLSPYDPRLGMGPLKRLFGEVFGDEEAAKFSNALLKNFAVPGVVVEVPREESRGWTRDKAIELKNDVTAEFSSEKRGHVGVLTGGAKMSQFGFSPDQLNLQMLHRLPEERISAVLRVPAIVAGLGAGLDRSTYANMREAREMYTETALIPQYSFDAATLNQQLKPDFTSRPSVYVKYDLTHVRALQEDEDRLWARVVNAVDKGLLTENEGRRRLGYPPVDDSAADELRAPSGGGGAPSPGGAAPFGGPPNAPGTPGVPGGTPPQATITPIPPSGGDQRRRGSANRMISGGKAMRLLERRS